MFWQLHLLLLAGSAFAELPLRSRFNATKAATAVEAGAATAAAVIIAEEVEPTVLATRSIPNHRLLTHVDVADTSERLADVWAVLLPSYPRTLAPSDFLEACNGQNMLPVCEGVSGCPSDDGACVPLVIEAGNCGHPMRGLARSLGYKDAVWPYFANICNYEPRMGGTCVGRDAGYMDSRSLVGPRFVLCAVTFAATEDNGQSLRMANLRGENKRLQEALKEAEIQRASAEKRAVEAEAKAAQTVTEEEEKVAAAEKRMADEKESLEESAASAEKRAVAAEAAEAQRVLEEKKVAAVEKRAADAEKRAVVVEAAEAQQLKEEEKKVAAAEKRATAIEEALAAQIRIEEKLKTSAEKRAIAAEDAAAQKGKEVEKLKRETKELAERGAAGERGQKGERGENEALKSELKSEEKKVAVAEKRAHLAESAAAAAAVELAGLKHLKSANRWLTQMDFWLATSLFVVSGILLVMMIAVPCRRMTSSGVALKEPFKEPFLRTIQSSSCSEASVPPPPPPPPPVSLFYPPPTITRDMACPPPNRVPVRAVMKRNKMSSQGGPPTVAATDCRFFTISRGPESEWSGVSEADLDISDDFYREPIAEDDEVLEASCIKPVKH
eukprot:TRINITY_DN70079_c0_g1_i1.p1 TRINITY_DN70079_c0_g1~~TRINITY_DN70079_c0_g1_i1.p1  ORF type:complete len:612 (+),score=138.13 TRINITY_DN70079_c0_g1_i1:84-1919(+)